MRSPVAYLLMVLSLVVVTPAQAPNSARARLNYKLLSVHVKGLERFQEDQVVRATGLQLGHNQTEKDFKEAVRKLGDTGLFTDVAYSYRYTADGCDLELRVAENHKLIPILFDNFVWFSDDELISLLRARVPLFDGRLPAGGGLSDQIGDALNAILAERKIVGQAEGLESAALGGPIDGYTYTVKLHPVVIRNADFPGAAPAELPALQAAAKPLSGQEYLRSSVRPHEQYDFLPVYLSRGYLKANFSDAQAKVVEDGPRTLVDVTCPVVAGVQYKVKEVRWSGNSAFPADKLQALVHLKLGAPANAVQLQSDLEAVQKLYGTKGYLMARIKPNPVLDDAAETVAYQLEAVEGDVFHMGELQIDGIDSASAAKLAAQWQIKKGDVFDDSYMSRFFQIMYHDIGLSRSYAVVPKQAVNPQEKTVTVARHFVPKK